MLKHLITAILIFISILIQAQTDTTFYSTREPNSFRDVDYFFEPEYYELKKGVEKRNGKVEWFFLNHKPYGYGTYEDDKLNGPYVIFYENGIIKESGFFSDGELVALRKRRHPNGQMRSVEIMNNQDMNLENPKLVSSWDSLGTSMVVKGNGKYELTFFEAADYFEKGEYINGSKSGFWQTFKQNVLVYEEVYDTFGNLELGVSYDSLGNSYNYQKARVDAEFEGGTKAWTRFLSKKLKYPKEAKKLGIEGNVYVSFNVDILGKVINAQIVRSVGHGCDAEALRVVNLSSGKWVPGRLRGEKRTQRLVLRVVYRMR